MIERKHIAIGVNKAGELWAGHFGMSPHFYIYDKQGEFIEQRMNPYAAGQGKKKHHDTPQQIVDLLPECKVFIARQMGNVGKRKLVEDMGITPVITDEDTIRSALDAYLASPQG